MDQLKRRFCGIAVGAAGAASCALGSGAGWKRSLAALVAATGPPSAEWACRCVTGCAGALCVENLRRSALGNASWLVPLPQEGESSALCGGTAALWCSLSRRWAPVAQPRGVRWTPIF